MRRTFKAGDEFVVGQLVEWRHVSHWLAGEIAGPAERDTLGYQFYPVTNLRGTRTTIKGEPVRGYPGKVRAVVSEAPAKAVHLVHATDSQAQQSWWESLTPEQQEAYEDGIERRRAEREAGIDAEYTANDALADAAIDADYADAHDFDDADLARPDHDDEAEREDGDDA